MNSINNPVEPLRVQLGPGWCGQQDLDLHLLNENKNLNLARLPIPPCPHYVAILDYTRVYVNSMRPKSDRFLLTTKIDLHKGLILSKMLI